MFERGQLGAGRNERGSVLVWTTLVVALVAVVMLWCGRMAGDATDAATLQSVADLAALAGVDGGRVAASRVAERNGATLVATSATGEVLTVVVARGARRATASAAPEDAADATQEGGADL